MSILYDDAAVDAVQRLLEKGRAYVDSEGYLCAFPEPLPNDVLRLVIAARVVAFERQDPEALRELDQASEAFASRVPWGGES